MQGSNRIHERLRELAANIATEQDPDKFTALVKELNDLLDAERRPKPPADTVTSF
jgi:hypothetical protein